MNWPRSDMTDREKAHLEGVVAMAAISLWKNAPRIQAMYPTIIALEENLFFTAMSRHLAIPVRSYSWLEPLTNETLH